MRITIRMPDELYQGVKETAAQSGRTIDEVLEEAVRRGLDIGDRGTPQRYTVRATGSGGLRAGVDLSSNAAVAEALAGRRATAPPT